MPRAKYSEPPTVRRIDSWRTRPASAFAAPRRSDARVDAEQESPKPATLAMALVTLTQA